MRIDTDDFELTLVDRLTVRKMYRYYWLQAGEDVARWECTSLARRLEVANDYLGDVLDWNCQRRRWELSPEDAK